MGNYNTLIYKNVVGVKATAIQSIPFNSWNDFKNYLINRYNTTFLEHKRQNYNMISGTSLTGGRNKGDIISTSLWIACDIDNIKDKYFTQIIDMFKKYEFIIYNSASCRQDDIRFRIVFPISRQINVKEYRHFWINLDKSFENILDKQTKHIERMQGMPAQFENAFNFIASNDGMIIDVDDILSKFEYIDNDVSVKFPLLLKNVHKKLTNNYTWSSHTNCPFVQKDIVDKFHSLYNQDGVGKYVLTYSMMCSIAQRAVFLKYPINVKEIVALMKEIDYNNIYKGRNWEVEAQNAINFALQNSI